METEPLDRIEEHASGETPEDVAILYSWANLQGAKYRDFSANRREYRAQMRHRAAEQLRLMELRAQSEAEAAAAQAEAEAAAAHADADAATVKLAASRARSSSGTPGAPEAILEEKEVEQSRRTSLREAAQQARRAAAERLEAARRAEAAALADSIARREEREIAEAQASALRQAAQYHDSEMKSRQIMAQNSQGQVAVPGHLNDPYSPQILAEGEYYDGPGAPPSELQASRFRLQREYIERATGAELPPFKMPPLFDEDTQANGDRLGVRPPRPGPAHPDGQRQDAVSAGQVPSDRPRDNGRSPTPVHSARDFDLQQIPEISPERGDYYMERRLHEDRSASLPYGREAAAPGSQGARTEVARNRVEQERSTVPSTPYNESHGTDGKPAGQARPEVVNRIPDNSGERNGLTYDQGEAFVRHRSERSPDRRYEPRVDDPDRRVNTDFDGSLLQPGALRPAQPLRPDQASSSLRAKVDSNRQEYAAQGALDRPRSQMEWVPEDNESWMQRRSAPPARTPEARSAREQHGDAGLGQLHASDQYIGHSRADLFDGSQPHPVTPRPSGSWLKRISGEKHSEPQSQNVDAGSNSVRLPSRPEPQTTRPSVEATYPEGWRSDSLTQAESHPSGFRPPWLTQAQVPRPSGSRLAMQSKPVPEKHAAPDGSTPRWLYQELAAPETALASSAPTMQPVQQPKSSPSEATSKSIADAGNTLQGSREAVASRWFALKGVFARPDVAEPGERQALREKARPTSAAVPASIPTIAVFSLAGGVGKTSLVATLGRALSSLGEKVLLADTSSHGLLPFYFGAKDLQPDVVRTFTPPNGSSDALVSLVSYSLNATGASSEAQHRMLDDLLASSRQASRILIDLNPNCVWIVESIEKLGGRKPMVLVPLAADMNSILSLQAVEESFHAKAGIDGEPLRPVYLLNQFDASLPLHLDVREVLRQHLGDRLLPFVVRRATGVSEALAEGMTIVDYDPDSAAAHDFLGLANWIRAVSAPAAAGFRNLRWSER